MGTLTVRNRHRQYVIELETHGTSKTELPIEKLHAVFLEGGFNIPVSPSQIASILNKGEMHSGAHVAPIRNRKFEDIIRRAKGSRTEIWFGDVVPTKTDSAISYALDFAPPITAGTAGWFAARKITRRKALKALVAIAGAGLTWKGTYANILSLKGNAEGRTIPRQITRAVGELNPVVYKRNKLVAHKINKLADISGSRRIGVVMGAGHENLAQLIKAKSQLTQDEIEQVAKEHGPEGQYMHRCVFNPRTKEWRVYVHQI